MNLFGTTTRKASAAIALVAVVGGGYGLYRSTQTAKAETHYGLATVAKDTIVSSVAGSGQVAGSRQVDVKPKVGAKINKISVKVGDSVKVGTVLAQLDPTDAYRTIRDAQQSVHDAGISLQSAQLQLKKDMAPADSVQMAQAEDALAKAKRDLQTLQAGPTAFDLKQAQADVDSAARNAKMTSDGSMPQVVRDAYDLYVLTLQSTQQSFDKILDDADNVLGIDNPIIDDGIRRMFSTLNSGVKLQATTAYPAARDAVAASKLAVTDLSLTNADPAAIDQAMTAVSNSARALNLLLGDVADGLQMTLTDASFSQSSLNGYKSTISSDQATINSKLSGLSAADKSIDQAKDTYSNSQINYQKAVNALERLKAGADVNDILTAQERVKEQQASLDKLKGGLTGIDLQLEQNSVAQRASSYSAAVNRLSDARAALADYTILAPFDGIVSKVPLQAGDEASSGAAVVTMVTNQQVVSIPLNEVDAAKVKLGQKATVTFDAIDGLTLTGEVAQVDPVGTVSQGVVTYAVQVAFDSQDQRVKPGMSSSISIITDIKADVLTVPNAAVKTQGDQSYVEELDVTNLKPGTDGLYSTTQTPRRVMVTVGSANDSMTEIASGLKEGDQVIAQTVKISSTPTATQTSSGLNLLQGGNRAAGFGGAGGGQVRFQAGGR